MAIFAGFFGWLTANMVYTAVKAWRERSALLAAMAGNAPVDGRYTVLVGRIEPLGRPLVAPFSGTECVAYSFEVFQILGGRRARKAVYYDGIAVTPSVIVTPAGSIRLLAVPDLDCEETSVSRDTALRLAADHIRTATFEPPPPPFSRPAIGQQWSDDDGWFRRETRHVTGEVDLSACTLSQRQIECGAHVCVFGQYSEAKRAIVADPGDWSKITRVMKGDPAAVVRRLGSQVTSRSVGALLFAAAAAGLIAAFVANTSPSPNP